MHTQYIYIYIYLLVDIIYINTHIQRERVREKHTLKSGCLIHLLVSSCSIYHQVWFSYSVSDTFDAIFVWILWGLFIVHIRLGPILDLAFSKDVKKYGTNQIYTGWYIENSLPLFLGLLKNYGNIINKNIISIIFLLLLLLLLLLQLTLFLSFCWIND